MPSRPSRPPAAPRPLESDVARAVEQLLAAYSLDVDRNNVGGRYYTTKDGRTKYLRHGRKGDADYSGMLPDGRKFDLELKRPGTRPTPAQLARLRLTNAQGGVGLWVTDAAQLAVVLPKLLAGWWVEIDVEGKQYVTDGKE